MTLPNQFPEFDFKKHTFNPAKLAAMREALESILNVEAAARIGATSGALIGLDVGYHFDKVRAALAMADH